MISKTSNDDFKFGILFSTLALIIFLYLFFTNSINSSKIFFIILIIFSIITIFKPTLFKPIRFFWIHIGISIGKISNLIILFVLFFIIISPLAIFLKILGRDVLKLRMNKNKTSWQKKEYFFEFSEYFKRKF